MMDVKVIAPADARSTRGVTARLLSQIVFVLLLCALCVTDFCVMPGQARKLELYGRHVYMSWPTRFALFAWHTRLVSWLIGACALLLMSKQRRLVSSPQLATWVYVTFSLMLVIALTGAFEPISGTGCPMPYFILR